MAGLVNIVDKEIYCGATIISEYYALSAAHCVENQLTSKLGLVVGLHNPYARSSPKTKLFGITQYIIHPDYDTKSYLNDIAVLRTRGGIVYSAAVGPICLPFKFFKSNFLNATVTALGKL